MGQVGCIGLYPWHQSRLHSRDDAKFKALPHANLQVFTNLRQFLALCLQVLTCSNPSIETQVDTDLCTEVQSQRACPYRTTSTKDLSEYQSSSHIPTVCPHACPFICFIIATSTQKNASTIPTMLGPLGAIVFGAHLKPVVLLCWQHAAVRL